MPRRTDDIDDFQSPAAILDPLLPYLNPTWIVWECCAGEGNLVKKLTQEGFWTIGTDILHGQDFFTYEPGFPFELILTNPPFTLKNQFLERCYALGKPFALLMPIHALDTYQRQRLYKQHGLEILMLPSQVTFHNTAGKAARFVCAWFCRGILPQQLKFT